VRTALAFTPPMMLIRTMTMVIKLPSIVRNRMACQAMQAIAKDGECPVPQDGETVEQVEQRIEGNP
jgi:hypothetical protein